MAEEGKSCEVQKQMLEAIKEGKQIKELNKTHPAYNFKDIWAGAGIENTARGEIVIFNTRTYIQASLRNQFMKLLYSSLLLS